MKSVRIAIAQINLTVGDIKGNCAKIVGKVEEARELGADIVVFPEMAVSGYPPEDLLLKPDFLKAAQDGLLDLGAKTTGITAIVGTPYAASDLHNAAAVFHNGSLVELYFKQYLPNYGVFDEDRYFRPGDESPVFAVGGEFRLGVSICEDIWYPDGPHFEQVAQGGAHLLINISASPYEVGKGQSREQMICTRAADSAAFVAYCNLVGGQDELVFDGYSMVCGPSGELIARAPQFEEALLVADLDIGQVFARRLHDPRLRKAGGAGAHPNSTVRVVQLSNPYLQENNRRPTVPMLAHPLDPIAEVYEALVHGTRDYATKNGFARVVVGLSGGVDSCLTAAIAARAMGPTNTVGVAMPSRYSSEHSLEDANKFAASAGIEYRTIPIDDVFQAFLEALAPEFGNSEAGVAEENLQARVRGAILMALSNKFGWLVLTTGNKSEVGVGYATLYGDMAGGFAVIKDVPKTLVYELCRHINSTESRELIPQRVLTKAPSAELRPNQKDSDSLPEYRDLDKVLQYYVQESRTISEIVEFGFDRQLVEKVIRLIDRSEYKRRQSPPGVKIMPRAFGKDWRLPITNAYRPTS